MNVLRTVHFIPIHLISISICENSTWIRFNKIKWKSMKMMYILSTDYRSHKVNWERGGHKWGGTDAADATTAD